MSVFAAQAGEGRHRAVARVIRAGGGHDDADVRHRRRRHARLVGAAAPDEFQAAQVLGRELAVDLAHGAELARLRDVVVVLGVVECADRGVRRRQRIRRTAAAGVAGVAGHAKVGKEVGGEGRAADLVHAALRPHAGAREGAFGGAQGALLVVVEHAEHADAVAPQVAPAARQVDALLVAAALAPGLVALVGEGAALDRALGDEVDDAADGVGAVDGRGAVAQHLDPFQRRHRDDVQVDRVGEVGVVGQAPAVQQHQGLVAAQAAQVGHGAPAGAGADRG